MKIKGLNTLSKIQRNSEIKKVVIAGGGDSV
jgi:tRNA A22 N-methylase